MPSIDMIATGDRLESLRKSKGLRVRDIQDLFNFEYPEAIYRWERGESVPTVDHLLILSRFYGLNNIEELLVVKE